MCDHCGCRSFPPIAELTSEHEEILRVAWDLAEAERAGRRPSAADKETLLALLDVHVVKEETGLYPQLVACGGAPAEAIAELESEHRDLHEALGDGGVFDRRAFCALQRGDRARANGF